MQDCGADDDGYRIDGQNLANDFKGVENGHPSSSKLRASEGLADCFERHERFHWAVVRFEGTGFDDHDSIHGVYIDVLLIETPCAESTIAAGERPQ